MITNYQTHPNAAIHGLSVGERPRPRTYEVPYLPQITQVRFTAGALTTDVAWSFTDDETGQVYTATTTGSATEATMLASAVAELRLQGEIANLFTFAEDGVDDVTITARHANRTYTIVATGGPSATVPVTTITQEAGGARVSFGFLARGSTARTVQALSATTELADLVGVLRRTEGNHYREIPDVTDGVTPRSLSVDREINIWLKYAGDEPDFDGDLYLRRATTSGSSSIVGDLLAAPAGAAAVYTATPTAVDLPGYGFEFGWRGRHYTASYSGDGTTTVAVACDGLVFDLGTIAGLTISDEATHVEITTAAGEDLDYIRATLAHTDVPAASVTIAEDTAADIDAIKINAIAEVIETLPGLNLAFVHVNIR